MARPLHKPTPGVVLVLLALAAAAQLAPARAAQVAMASAASSQGLAATARTVNPAGGRLTVNNVALAGNNQPVTLQLTSTSVWTPGAQVVIHPGNGAPIVQGTPNTRYFEGSIAGSPGSAAVLTVLEDNSIRGIVTSGKKAWTVNSPAPSAGPTAAAAAAGPLASTVATPQQLAALPAPRCGTESNATSSLASRLEAALGGNTRSLLQANDQFTVNMFIETDGEFWALFQSDDGAREYITTLVLYSNTIFRREVGATINIAGVNIWRDSQRDPWELAANVQTGDHLNALKAWYNEWPHRNNQFSSAQYNMRKKARDLVHYLSGKRMNGGVAWLGDVCTYFSVNPEDDRAYALSGRIDRGLDWNRNPNSNPAAVVWDAVVFMHETGHSLGSPHTHEYCNIGGSADTIDDCAKDTRTPSANVQICPQSGITFTADNTGPLPDCPGGNNIQAFGGGRGTIMSYCHLLDNGVQNVAMTLGTGHPCGRAPQRVPGQIRGILAQRARQFQGCFKPPNNNEPCKQDAAKGCATCAPAPNQNNCATCTSPNHVVDPATGRCGPRPNNNEPCKQDAAKGCATCAPAPNQNNCATCTNPAHIVTNGRCGPHTFTPVIGTMLSDNRGIGFNGRPITYQGRIGEMIDIVSAAPFWSLNGRLIRGSRWSSRSLGSVTWTYDNKVHVELKHGRMMVWVNGRLQRQGPVMALSSKTKCHVRPEKCHKGGWCDNRTVDITRPGISITVSQPFVRQGRKGYFGNWLEIQVTLQAEPRQQLTGYLGQTILLRPN